MIWVETIEGEWINMARATMVERAIVNPMQSLVWMPDRQYLIDRPLDDLIADLRSQS